MTRLFLSVALLFVVPAMAPAQVLRAAPKPAAEPPRLFSSQGTRFGDSFNEQYRQVYEVVARRYASREVVSKLKLHEGVIKTVEERDQRIKELLAQLDDEWTEYRTAAEILEVMHWRDMGYVSPGMRLDRRPEGWVVSIVGARTAAEKAGLRPGDRVVEFDGAPLTLEMTKREANLGVLGLVGGEVEVKFVEAGKKEPTTTKLTYLPYDATVVEAKRLPGNVVYVRVTTFMNWNLLREFAAALSAMQAEGEGRIDGLILDLRGNTGGLVDLAFEFAGAFVKQGAIGRTRSREGRVARETTFITEDYLPELMTATKANTDLVAALQKVPMVTLINGSTMSSGELLVNALKDSGRSEVLGEQTWGKGVSFVSLPCFGGELQLVTGTFTSPTGFNHNKKGIAPHTVVVQPRQGEDLQLKEALASIERKVAAAASPAGESARNSRDTVEMVMALLIAIGLVFVVGSLFGVIGYWLSTRRTRTVSDTPVPTWVQELEAEGIIEPLVLDDEPAAGSVPVTDLDVVDLSLTEADNVVLPGFDAEILPADSLYINTPCNQCGTRFAEGDLITHLPESSGCFTYCLQCMHSRWSPRNPK